MRGDKLWVRIKKSFTIANNPAYLDVSPWCICNIYIITSKNKILSLSLFKTRSRNEWLQISAISMHLTHMSV
jgi:hypothetical protein